MLNVKPNRSEVLAPGLPTMESKVSESSYGHDSSMNSPMFNVSQNLRRVDQVGPEDDAPLGQQTIRRRGPHVMTLTGEVMCRSWSNRTYADIPRLLDNMERALTIRLDRIDNALRLLLTKQEDPESGHVAEAARLGIERKLVEPEGMDVMDMIQGSISEGFASKATGGERSDFIDPRLSCLSLRADWQKEALRMSNEALALPSQTRQMSRSLAFLERRDDDDDPATPWYLLLPSARMRLLWDVLTMIIIAHDMAVVPVALAFKKGQDLVLESLFWPFLIFWTLDIPLSFLTGFYRNGRIEVRPRVIAVNYCKTWLIIDVAMVASTWMEAWAGDGRQGYLLGRVGKSLRFLRVMHSIRILRMAKLRRLTEEFHDRVTSEYYHILISVVKLMVTILWINHFIACAWWGLGVNALDSWEHESWTEHYKIEESSLGFQYFTSLHWSLTQFTPAGMEVSARNLPERIFSVIVLLFAMVAFSSFVSSITASMTQLRQLASRYDSNFSLLRRYLQSHQVPIELLVRILHCVHYRLRREVSEIQESQVQFLQFLSKPLQMELSSHIFTPMLSRHPFFKRYAEVDNVAMRHVCLKAVSQSSLSTEDLLFTEGSRCEHMYYVMSGQLIYSMRRKPNKGLMESTENEDLLYRDSDDQAEHMGDLPMVLDEQQWCCEISMWCPWVHVGTAVAMRMSEVLQVDVNAFCSVTGSFHLVRQYSAIYAESFVEKMVASQRADPTAWSDLSVFSVDELGELIVSSYQRRKLAHSDRSASVLIQTSTRGDECFSV